VLKEEASGPKVRADSAPGAVRRRKLLQLSATRAVTTRRRNRRAVCSSAQPLIAALGLKASASSSEKKARQELLGEFGATVTPEEMDAIRKSWTS
jgi:hypothetical protein